MPVDRVEDLAARVAERIDGIASSLSSLAQAISASSEIDLERIRSMTRNLLDLPNMELAIGVGFAVDYTIDGRSPAMVWWRRKDGSVIARTHGSDPDTDSFYDYASLRWFAAAKQSKQTTVSGPFIDSWGTDDYTVTVSYPVLTDDDCAGVLAADVDLPQIVEAWTEAVGESEREMALVNENDRVVASTVPTLSTGLLIRPRNVSDSIFEVEQRCAVSKFGWSIVVLQRR